MKRYILYLAYGKTDILHELIYSLYSLLKQYQGQPPFHIVVYTDNVAYLQQFLPEFITYHPLTPAQIQEWRGKIDFVHRVKVMTLRDFSSNYQGSTLYLDTDTIFTQPVEHLFALIEQGETYVTHENEGFISSRKNLIFKKIDKFLRSAAIDISPDTIMYNAGTIGFNTSDHLVLDKVLATTDQLYHLYQKHIMEQLAFSYQLHKAAQKPIYTATQEIFHYWDFKEFRIVLGEFFKYYQGKPYTHLLTKMDLIDPRKLILPKREYVALSFLPKTLRKLTGNRWAIPAYTLS